MSYFPFDSGAGANVQEAQWRDMARHWLRTGVLAGEADEFQVAQTGGGAMSVDVATGEAWVRGHFVSSDEVELLPIAPADLTNDRIDRIVMRADFVANTVTLEVLEGTPDPAPAVPALTQSAARWEIGLAQVLVQNGAVSILTADITDERELVFPEEQPKARVYRDSPQSIPNVTDTVITFNQERFDVGGLHDLETNTSRLTVPAGYGGVYEIGACIEFAIDADGFRVVRLRINGATVIDEVAVSSVGSGGPTRLNPSTVYELAAGDYVEVIVWHSAGGALNVAAVGNHSPEFWIKRAP